MRLPVPKEITVHEALQFYTKQKAVLKPKEVKQLSRGKSIIDKAQHVADQIIKEAKEKEKEILLLAEKEHGKGFESGAEEGKQQAIKEGLQWLMKTYEIKSSILHQIKDQILDTLESILLHVFQKAAPEWIKEQLEKALSSIEPKEKIQIHASEAHAASITEIISSAKYKGMEIETIYDPGDSDTCFVRTRYFEAEFSVSKLRETITEAFQVAFEEVEQ